MSPLTKSPDPPSRFQHGWQEKRLRLVDDAKAKLVGPVKFRRLSHTSDRNSHKDPRGVISTRKSRQLDAATTLGFHHPFPDFLLLLGSIRRETP